MTLLVDTHALVWWTTDPARLSPAAVSALNTADEVAVSGMTWFELACLVQRNRIELDLPFTTFADRLSAGLKTVGVSWAIAHAAAGLHPSFPSDPADRIIYATAEVNGWKLVTRDSRMHEHDPSRSVVVW